MLECIKDIKVLNLTLRQASYKHNINYTQLYNYVNKDERLRALVMPPNGALLYLAEEESL